MLDDVFETLTAPLRTRGGQVLKFIGDAMLATFSFEEGDQAQTCHRALDAAIEAMQALEARSAERAAAGLPIVSVDGSPRDLRSCGAWPMEAKGKTRVRAPIVVRPAMTAWETSITPSPSFTSGPT